MPCVPPAARGGGGTAGCSGNNPAGRTCSGKGCSGGGSDVFAATAGGSGWYSRLPERLPLLRWSPAYSLRGVSCTGRSTVRSSRIHSRFPRPSCGTAANVDRDVAWSQEIHPKPKPGAHRTGRLQNSRWGQSGLLEEILYPFVPVGCVAFGPPHFNRNPIDVADNRVMLLTSLHHVPSHTLLEPRMFRKPSRATCPAGTMTVL